jgi:hypothetical protein
MHQCRAAAIQQSGPTCLVSRMQLLDYRPVVQLAGPHNPCWSCMEGIVSFSQAANIHKMSMWLSYNSLQWLRLPFQRVLYTHSCL